MRKLLLALSVLFGPTVGCASAASGPPVRVDESTVRATAGTVSVEGGVVRMVTDGGRAEVEIRPADTPWDFSRSESLRIAVHNPGRGAVTVRASVENPGASGLQDTCRGVEVVAAGERGTLTLRLVRRPEDPGYEVFRPFYMYFAAINVRDNTVDPASLVRLVISAESDQPGQAVEVTSIEPIGTGVAAPVPFFPFVDAYGQYVHSDWPGKIYRDEDFAKQIDAENRDRAAHVAPADWNEFGGWSAGPKLKATGFFYAAKHEGKWWLVDPTGCLFWSSGPTGVGFGGDVTPITDREHWFSGLPARDDPKLGSYYRDGKNATYRYYKDRAWTGFDIAGANLLRKYGADYEAKVASLSHERMQSWGFNTLGNWSSGKVIQLRRTPYVVAIHYGSPGIHYRMPDVYDPAWEPAVRARMEKERGVTSEDPYNIGYFVDNERWFGWRPRAACIGEETLKNPPERHAKRRFVEMLRAKYRDIAALNAAWETKHESWEALLCHREPPNMKNPKALADCGDFGMAFSEVYFSTVRRIVKEVAPNIMYLGSRFHGHIDREVMRLAGKYCDVISYNIYDNPPTKRVDQYQGLDLPIMSTEWGIGSDPQQTPFRGSGLGTPTPPERARQIEQYLEAALRHPNLVGAHFFQYRDQPLSGRPDGEATLRGIINITDTPNLELISATRRLAAKMYRLRSEAK